jgi:2-oxoglutarate dehydrogenase E1 component
MYQHEWHQYFDSLQQTETISVRDVPALSHRRVADTLRCYATQPVPTTPEERIRPLHSLAAPKIKERKQVTVLQLINTYRFLVRARAALSIHLIYNKT